MATVFDVLVAMGQRLPGAVRGVASGGGYDSGAGQVYMDDALVLVGYDDDAWIGGTLLIETGILTGAVLPVADSVQSSGRVLASGLVWETNSGDTPVAGVRYTLIPSVWPTGWLLAAAFEALRAWGRVETEVTLGTGDGQTTTFDLPSGTTGEVVRIFITDDDDEPRTGWVYWETTDTGVELSMAPDDGDVVTAVVVGWTTLAETQALVALTAYGNFEGYVLLDGEGGYAGDTYRIIQTFTAQTGWEVGKIRLYMENPIASDREITVKLWNHAELMLAGQSGYEQLFSDATVSVPGQSDGWIEVDVGRVILEAGQHAVTVTLNVVPYPGLTWDYSSETISGEGAYVQEILTEVIIETLSKQLLMVIERTPASGSNVWPSSVPVEFGAWYGAYSLLRGRVGVPGQEQDSMVQLMNYALERAEQMRGSGGNVGARARERFQR